MDPHRKITEKFTKTFGGKFDNRQYFHRKSELKSTLYCLLTLQYKRNFALIKIEIKFLIDDRLAHELIEGLVFLAQQLVSCKDRYQIRVLVLRGHIFLIDQNSDSKTMLWQNAELN